jgi:hypothetical protein
MSLDRMARTWLELSCLTWSAHNTFKFTVPNEAIWDVVSPEIAAVLMLFTSVEVKELVYFAISAAVELELMVFDISNLLGFSPFHSHTARQALFSLLSIGPCSLTFSFFFVFITFLICLIFFIKKN